MSNKLTVCIPMYNASDSIKKCINSIEKSTEDVRIIIVDDNSTDNSYDIVANLNIKNLLLVKNTYGKGPGSARNIGIDLCTTEYITFCDADDFVPNFAYEKLLRIAASNSSDIVIGQYLRKIDNSKWYINTALKEKYVSEDYNHIQDESIVHINPAVWNKIYKLSMIKNNNIRFQDSFLAEDLEFSSHCFFHSNIINMTEDIVYCYHTITSKNNIISNISPERFKQGIFCLEKTINNFRELNEESFSHILNNSFKFLYNKLYTASPAEAIIMLGEIKTFLDKYYIFCDPFLVFSILGKSIDGFISSDPIELYIEKKKNQNITLDIIKNDIEIKFCNHIPFIPIEYLDIYLKILIKKKSWINALKIIDMIENNENYRITALKHKYSIFKIVKLWDRAYGVCKQLVAAGQNDYWLEMAMALRMCARYNESYKILTTHIYKKNFTYWKLRAELAEHLGNYQDSILSWKNIASCDASYLSISIENSRKIALIKNTI